jgi:hypothetical protein
MDKVFDDGPGQRSVVVLLHDDPIGSKPGHGIKGCPQQVVQRDLSRLPQNGNDVSSVWHWGLNQELRKPGMAGDRFFVSS